MKDKLGKSILQGAESPRIGGRVGRESAASRRRPFSSILAASDWAAATSTEALLPTFDDSAQVVKGSRSRRAAQRSSAATPAHRSSQVVQLQVARLLQSQAAEGTAKVGEDGSGIVCGAAPRSPVRKA